MCNNTTWPTFNSCSLVNQKHVGRNEPWYSNLFGARASLYSGIKVFAIMLALSLGTLLSLAGPVTAADDDTLIPRAKMEAAEQAIKALQMELAEARKDRAALQEQLKITNGDIAKQIEKVFTSKSWKSDPEVVVLRGKLDAAGREVERHAAATKASAEEVAALKVKLKAASSQIDILGKEKAGALSESSKLKDDLAAALAQTMRLEAEKAKFAESEKAHKATAQKLAIALTANKTQDKKLLSAKNTVKKFREELRAAGKDIADLEARLTKTEELQSALRQSKQLVESLKTKLDKSGKERNVLKVQLDETQNEIAQRIEKVFAAASQEVKESKQRVKQLDARIESVESEKSKLKQRYLEVQRQAAQLDKKVKESRAESEKLNKQVQAALAKADSALKERAQVEQSAAKEAETLRDQLAMAKQQISSAQAEAKNARSDLAKRIEKLISVAAAQATTEVNGLREKLAAANDEIEQLKAVQVKKSTSSVTQQPAFPSGATLESKKKKFMRYLSGEKDLKTIKN